MGLSFAAGSAAGLITVNPVVGVAVGAGVGLALGVGASVAIAKTNYNMYYNVAKSTVIIIAGNIGAGILGGLTGGMFHQAIIASEFNAIADALSANFAFVDAAFKSATITYCAFSVTSLVYAGGWAAVIISDVHGDAAHAAHVVASDATGDYNITAKYNGAMVSNKINVLPILNATDLTKKYGDSDKFVATLVDGQGKPYSEQKVQFNINGITYYRTTDSNGQAKLNINFMPGEYIITSSYNGFSIANKVTIRS